VLRSRKLRGSIDTSPIIGRGAVKDTYNLVADAMVKLFRALAAFETPLLEEVNAQRYASEHDGSRYFAEASLKGGAELDWDSESDRVAFLTGLVVDVRRALALARSSLESTQSFCGPRAGSSEDVRAAMQLLEQLVDQDIEVRDDGQAHIKPGVAKDRIVSVHDPEMRHGRKSKRTRFDGRKGEIVVDLDSGVIVDVSVKPGNAHDAEGSLDAIERAEETVRDAWAGAPVEEAQDTQDDGEAGIVQTLGDCAYGTAANRRAFLDADRELVAKQPALHNRGRFTKENFIRDENTGARICPAGHTAMPRWRTVAWQGQNVQAPFYRWPAALCAQCPAKGNASHPPRTAMPTRAHADGPSPNTPKKNSWRKRAPNSAPPISVPRTASVRRLNTGLHA